MSTGFASPSRVSQAGRGHLIVLASLLEKPDKTLPKKPFSSIIQRLAECWALFRRSSFMALVLHRASSVHFLLSFKLFPSFPIFPWAFTFCFGAGNNSCHPGPARSDKRKPSVWGRAEEQILSCPVSCVCTYSLALKCSFYFLPISSASFLPHNSFCRCTHFPICPRGMSVSMLHNLNSLDWSTALHPYKEEELWWTLPFFQILILINHLRVMKKGSCFDWG